MKISVNSIRLLYRTGKIDINGVKKAVVRGWITTEDFYNITGQKYDIE